MNLPRPTPVVAVPESARSPLWPAVERAHLRIQPRCACCADAPTSARVQVHHLVPVQFGRALGRPDLELDDRNLVTLCETEHGTPGENHHLLLGHLDDFQSMNLDVLADLATFHGLSAAQLRADPRWQAKVVARPKPLAQLSPAEVAALTEFVAARFPRR